MIELPCQIIAAFVGLVAVHLTLTHLRKTNCDDRVDVALRQGARQATDAYRIAYREGWSHGERDGQKAIERSAENNA